MIFYGMWIKNINIIFRMKPHMAEPNEQNELEIIKKLLIAQLILSEVSIRDIVKITGMSSATLLQIYPQKPFNRIKKG